MPVQACNVFNIDPSIHLEAKFEFTESSLLSEVSAPRSNDGIRVPTSGLLMRKMKTQSASIELANETSSEVADKFELP